MHIRQAVGNVLERVGRELRRVGDERAEGPARVGALKLALEALELGGVAAVQHDVEALGGELVAEGFTDAVAGAGDEGPCGFSVLGVQVAVQLGGADVGEEEVDGGEGYDGGDDAREGEDCGRKKRHFGWTWR